MEYESRISVNVESQADILLAKFVLNSTGFFRSLPMGNEDGSIFENSAIFDKSTKELILEGRGGPALRVAKYISSEYPDIFVRLTWLTDEGHHGARFFKSGQQN